MLPLNLSYAVPRMPVPVPFFQYCAMQRNTNRPFYLFNLPSTVPEMSTSPFHLLWPAQRELQMFAPSDVLPTA